MDKVHTIKIAAASIMVMLLIGLFASLAAPTPGDEPVRVILDSDMASDCDDVASLTVLHALANEGKAKIVAAGVSDRYKWSPLCMDAINTYYGHPDIPIGAVKDKKVWSTGSKYAKQVAEKYPRSRDWESAADAPDVIDVYRKALADQPDGSVVFISVGTLANASNLLKSGPDEHSDLTGKQLVEKKVRHWVCMGGAFMDKWKNKKEANVYMAADHARHALANWPTKVSFMSYGIGRQMKTGPGLKKAPKDHICRYAYQVAVNLKPHTSFDQAAVLYAIEGLDSGAASDYWDMSDWGWVIIHDDRTSSFKEDPTGKHRYTTATHNTEKIEQHIERLMRYTPE